MFAILRVVIAWAVGSFVTRLFLSLGIGIAGYTVFNTIVAGGLDRIETAFQGLPSDLINILALGGVGEGLSIMGSALLTASAIRSARVAFVRG